MLLRRRIRLALKSSWVLAVLWFEVGIFRSAVRECEWPDSLSTQEHGAKPTRILIIADPQIPDRRSYPGRPPILELIARTIIDLNLRKNWHAALYTHPDAVVFLGDMMDGGREKMSDAEYEGLFRRFASMFRVPTGLPYWFVPGNHDIGLEPASSFSPNANARYVSHYGALNQQRSIANHTLVLIDAPGFADEERVSGPDPIPGGTVDFVLRISRAQQTDPVVLFSHIPLWRADGASCGPLRERGTIRAGSGHGYQNLLSERGSQFLLESLRPAIVFSGDDHDYCDHTHRTHRTREISVKSLSMAMGIKRPGFQLLSLIPTTVDAHGPRQYTVPCFLPFQLGIYSMAYVPMIICSLGLILLINLERLGRKKDEERNKSCTVTFLREEDLDEGHEGEMAPARLTNRPLRRRIASFSSTLDWCSALTGKDSRTERDGFWRNVLDDVIAVASLPVGVLVFISVWTFWH